MGVVAVLWSPVRPPRRVDEGRGALPGLLVVAAYAALGLLSGTALVLTGFTRGQIERSLEQSGGQPGLPPGFFDGVIRAVEISIPVSAALSPFVIWLLVSLRMQLVTRFFGGTGPFRAMLGVVGVARNCLSLSSSGLAS